MPSAVQESMRGGYQTGPVLVFSLLVLGAPSLSAIDRGLGNPKSVYIPKGTVALTLSGGYNQWKATAGSFSTRT